MSSENKALQRGTKQLSGDFHNPYNFVPALPRNNIKNSELGDRLPASHGKYHHSLWSGTMTIKLTTKTPLLIPDAATSHQKNSKEEDNHLCFDIRRNPFDESQPFLPATSIKGMLRTAYEIVTNSRYSIFVEHQDRLAYRMAAREVNVIPARVEQHNDKKLYLHLMEGKNIILDNNEKNLIGGTAKLPRYKRIYNDKDREYFRKLKNDNGISFPLLYDNGNPPEHGNLVWVRLNDFGEDDIKKSIVTRIKLRDESLDPNPPGNGNWHKGIVFISNENIKGKKYERVFIDRSSREPIEITSKISALWEELITNYQQIHIRDLEQRDIKGNPYDRYLESKPGKTAWSRHIYELNSEKLKPGTLLYVEFAPNDDNTILALLPVILSRQLYDISPDLLLGFQDTDTNLRPPSNLEELSPADRVFGCVKSDVNIKKQKEHIGDRQEFSYKGNLRIGKIKCTSDRSIQNFEGNGFPLAILGQPNPQQARFYAAENKQGQPLKTGKPKKYGYKSLQGGLRGRKVYPHHRDLPKGHWTIPQNLEEQKISNNGQFKEWYRVGDITDDQNRSIKAWVKPNTTFEFNIDVTNLSTIELGALLWLFQLPETYYHRLGGGKPLGFGSVYLKLDPQKTDLRKGKDWQQYYKSLTLEAKSNPIKIDEIEKCIQAFKEEITNCYNDRFDSVSFIKAFCISCKGFEDGKSIHYPRVKSNNNDNNEVSPQENGEGFKWFVENEKEDRLRSLPYLLNDVGLPYYSVETKNDKKGKTKPTKK